jgi:nucleoside-diphosphate-sugar epimerase
MRVVLTGSNGFIGKAILKYLIENGHEVYCLIRKDSGYSKQQGIFYGNLEDIYESKLVTEIKNWHPDVFCHMGWRGVGGNSREIADNNVYNLKLVLDTIKLANDTGCEKWIGAGSQAEYGIQNKLLIENDECLPVTNYGKAKLKAGTEALALCDKMNITGCWARIFSVYGPGDHTEALIPYVIQKMKTNEAPNLTSCTQFWDFLFIEDAAKALIALAENRTKGVYNIASGRTVQIKEVVENIASIANYNGAINYSALNDSSLNYLGARIDKIQGETNWNANIDLTTGLNKTVNSYYNA